MKTIYWLYSRLLDGCLLLAGLTVVVIVALVVSSIIGRATGLYYFQASIALTEYALQFATMLAAPAVLRKKGHIFLTMIYQYLPHKGQAVLERMVYLVGLAVCVVVTYVAAGFTVRKFLRHAVDIRSIDLPGWILFATLVFGFGLMAVEFAIYLFGNRSMFDASENAD